MRAEAVSRDERSVNNPPALADDEKWHVQFAPDEVKVVSLEQMDDLFRLSIIDSETPVWQAGMSEWQPLRVIAGLEEEPAAPPQHSPPKLPAPKRAASPSQRPAPPPPRPAAASIRAPAPSMRPAPPSIRPVELAPAPSIPPAPAALAVPAEYASPATSAAPTAFAAPVNAMNSVRPLVVSHLPPPARAGDGGFGRFLVGVSLLAGVAVTAYRNDLVREGAHAAHQDALYARLESALGGPGFGTVRGLERSAAAQPTLDVRSNDVAPVTVRTAVASPLLESPSRSTTAAGVASAVPLESLASLQPKQAATPAPAKPQPARVSAAQKAPVERLAPQTSASIMNERERLNAAIGQAMVPSKAAKTKGGKAKTKGNEYDPLNPSL